jgi:hypothetical protein
MKTKIDGTYFLKLFSMALLLMIIAPHITIAQTGKVNFTGSWTLNAGKSTMGDNPRMGGGDFTAKQEANLLTVDRTFTNRDGQTMTSNMKYTLDGKESLNTSARGESKSVATWSADGKTLTISTTRTMNMNGESMTIKSVENWVLTDPKTITIKSTATTPNGERNMTLVYDKK